MSAGRQRGLLRTAAAHELCCGAPQAAAAEGERDAVEARLLRVSSEAQALLNELQAARCGPD